MVGVLGSLTTRYDLVISCKRGESGQIVVITDTPRAFLAACCETDHVSLTNYCLTWTSNIYGTGPEPTTKSSSSAVPVRPSEWTIRGY